VTSVVDVETRCFLPFPRPGRFIVDSVSRTLRVASIPAGGAARASFTPVPTLEGCQEFLILSAKGRVVDLRIAD
jgi:hypothetical protein